jgi:hypothetical protein
MCSYLVRRQSRAIVVLSSLVWSLVLVPIGSSEAKGLNQHWPLCAGACKPKELRADSSGREHRGYQAFQSTERPTIASGSYGAMLEGRNPVSSSGF